MKYRHRWLWDAAAALIVTLFFLTVAAARGEGVLAAAEAAFERKDYASALPLLQQLAEDTKDNRSVWLELKKRINICKDNLKPEEFEKLSWTPGMKRLEPTRQTHDAPKAGEVRSLGIKQLGNFDYDADQGGKIPDDVKALSGMKVRMWGYMVPLRQADKISEFALVPSLGSCCFGQAPGVQHVITVTVAKGAEAALSTEPVFVTGTLVVDEQRKDDFTSSIFEIHEAKVEDAGKEIKDAMKGPVRTGPKDNPLK